MTSAVFRRQAALDDLIDHFVFLAENADTDTAERFLINAEAAFDSLSLQPLIGSPLRLKHPDLAGMRKWRIKAFGCEPLFSSSRIAAGSSRTGSGARVVVLWLSRHRRSTSQIRDEAFVERMQACAEPLRVVHNKGISRAQRLRPLTWQAARGIAQTIRSRALHMAYRQAGMTMTALAKQADLSVSHVSQLIAIEEVKG